MMGIAGNHVGKLGDGTGCHFVEFSNRHAEHLADDLLGTDKGHSVQDDTFYFARDTDEGGKFLRGEGGAGAQGKRSALGLGLGDFPQDAEGAVHEGLHEFDSHRVIHAARFRLTISST